MTSDARSVRVQWWRDWLGAERDPRGTWSLHPRPDNPEGWQDADLVLHSYGTDLGARLLRPVPTGRQQRSPVVIVPFYETATLVGEPCLRTAQRPPDRPTQAYAVELARRGVAALAVPWWFEQMAAGSPARNLAERYGPPAAAHAAAQDRTALGRSIADLFLAVDALLDQDWVDPERIGVHGHSLGSRCTWPRWTIGWRPASPMNRVWVCSTRTGTLPGTWARTCPRRSTTTNCSAWWRRARS